MGVTHDSWEVPMIHEESREGSHESRASQFITGDVLPLSEEDRCRTDFPRRMLSNKNYIT